MLGGAIGVGFLIVSEVGSARDHAVVVGGMLG